MPTRSTTTKTPPRWLQTTSMRFPDEISTMPERDSRMLAFAVAWGMAFTSSLALLGWVLA